MSLDDPRAQLDALDDEIVRLLDERARIVGDVSRAKREANLPPYDPEREQQVLDRLSAQAARFPADAVRAVYREVMSASLAMQEPVRIAYLGPEGTFSQEAARVLFGLAARYVEQTTIAGVFDAVARQATTYGVAPIENSSEGSVNEAVDVLLDGSVLIRREFEMEVSQCLLTRSAGLSSIERVYSHSQALGQCRLWLAKNLPGAQIVQAGSTAAAVREAVGDEHGAAIASRLASEVYRLPILRERIQDDAENVTRFVVLALDDAPRTGRDKTTMSFTVRDERGALKRVLEIFEQEEINLTRIQSRPSRQKAWDYLFLVDLEGHREDKNLLRATERLRSYCPLVRHLGSYPRAATDREPRVAPAVEV
jgi:chorismate mutase/prephenate dehydratase